MQFQLTKMVVFTCYKYALLYPCIVYCEFQ